MCSRPKAPFSARLFDAKQTFGVDGERFIGAHLRIPSFSAKPLVGSAPHPFRSVREMGRHARITPEPNPDLVGSPEVPIHSGFALAGVGQAIAVPAQEIAPAPIQLGHAPVARNPVYHARAHEVGTTTPEPARLANDADGLLDVLPVPASAAEAIRDVQQVNLSPETDRGDPFAILRTLPAPGPARLQTAGPLQAVHV